MDRIILYKLKVAHQSRVYNSGKWIDGQKIKELEERLQQYLNVKFVVLTNSGTSSLLTAYWVLKNEFRALSVDPYTFPATYQSAKILNYKVHFIKHILESEPPLSGEELNVITHLFGQPNNLLSKIGESPFIEDACQAFGAEHKGKKVGTFGKFGCFSFYPTKSLHTCGHGGALVTNNEEYYRAAKVFIESGRINGSMTNQIALNLRIDEIKAEFLLHELVDYDERVARQRHIAQEFIGLVPTNQPLLGEVQGDRHIYSTFNICIDQRDKFKSYMDKLGIDTAVYYDKDILPEKERQKYEELTSRIVAIPCRWNLTDAEIKKIKKALQGWFD